MALASLIGPVDAGKLGEEVYELILTGWGNLGAAGGQPANKRYPASASDQPIGTVTGIAISPRSQVDRARILYNSNPGRVIDTPSTSVDIVATTEQEVSIDRPWAGQLDGPLTILACQETCYNDQYLPAGAAAATFGTALPIFIAPELRLLLWLRGAPAQPTRRAPLLYAAAPFPTGGAGVQAEQLVGVVNVQGRRHIRIMTRGNTVGAGSSATTRFGGVASAVVAAGGPATLQSVECELVAANALDPNEAACVTLDHPQIQFLTIYMARAGAGSTGGAFVYIEALD